MGIQDRDFYRERYRNVSSLKRGGRPLSTGRLAAFWIALLAIAFAVFRLVPTLGPSTRASVVAAPTVAPPVRTVQPASRPVPSAPARPVPSDEGRAEPSTTAPIYRCGNRYAHEPCVGGHAIDGSVASGFDSRPSERMARLVAEGRAADGDSGVTRTVTTTTVTRNGVEVASTAGFDRDGQCQALAAEIAAIDRSARQPLPVVMQDRLRTQRRTARDRQAALHC